MLFTLFVGNMQVSLLVEWHSCWSTKGIFECIFFFYYFSFMNFISINQHRNKQEFNCIAFQIYNLIHSSFICFNFWLTAIFIFINKFELDNESIFKSHVWLFEHSSASIWLCKFCWILNFIILLDLVKTLHNIH